MSLGAFDYDYGWCALCRTDTPRRLLDAQRRLLECGRAGIQVKSPLGKPFLASISDFVYAIEVRDERHRTLERVFVSRCVGIDAHGRFAASAMFSMCEVLTPAPPQGLPRDYKDIVLRFCRDAFVPPGKRFARPL